MLNLRIGQNKVVNRTAVLTTKFYYCGLKNQCAQRASLNVVPLRATVVLVWAAYGPLLKAPNFVTGRASNILKSNPNTKNPVGTQN